jgi:hypothetical protein
LHRPCINFSVSSNPTLSKETSRYTLDPGSQGLLNLTLDALANANKGKDTKLSIAGKKLAIGLGDKVDANLGGLKFILLLWNGRTGKYI